MACPCMEMSFNVQPVMCYTRCYGDQTFFTLKSCYILLHTWNKICLGANNARMRITKICVFQVDCMRG